MNYKELIRVADASGGNAMDAEYMSAVEAGDMEGAMQLVKAAFKVAYPDNKLGARIFYKGKNGEWTDKVAGYFTSDRDFAYHYGQGEVREFFLIMNNPFIYDFQESGSDGDFPGLDGVVRTTEAVMREADAESKGYDGYILCDVGEGYSPGMYVIDDYIVKDFRRVKAADVVVYDINGDVILLSRRF